MRADRLVAILLILQRKGRITALEVAEELEVSERTARRDLEALGMAGLPIYSVQGRNGGWMLAGGGKTDLSGLSAAEVRALFMVAGPSTATPNMKAALRKLVRALPESFRDEAEAAQHAIVIDPTSWDGGGSARRDPPLLDEIQRSVIAGEQLSLSYVARDGASTQRVAHPLGLAAKGAVWYLIAGTDGGIRTFRVDRIVEVQHVAEPVVRPDGFVLSEAWALITDEVNERRLPIRAELLVDPGMLAVLRARTGQRIRIGGTRIDGRIDAELRGQSVLSLGGDLAGFGGSVEVIEPAELIERMSTLAGELAALYPDRRRSVSVRTRPSAAGQTQPRRGRGLRVPPS